MKEKAFEAYKISKKPLADAVEVVRRLSITRGGGSSSVAFLITCLDFFYRKDHTKQELVECITDGNMDLSICDLVCVHDDGAVDIFDVREGENKVSASRIAEAKLALTEYFLNKPADLGSCNEILKKQLEKAHKIGIREVNLYFIRRESGVVKGFAKLLSGGLTSVQIITPNELVKRRLLNSYLPFCELSSTEKAIEKKTKHGYSEVILKVRLRELLEIYNEHLSKKIDFFSANVRNPKRSTSFASGLEQTLRDRPKMFHLFHNGITMTASEIKKTGAIYKVFSPQIVNGAQTLGNIADLVTSKKISKISDDACVLCKVVEANDELIDDICEASNTQRAVGVVDLRSNDNFQKELALFIDAVGEGKFSYIRKPMSGRGGAKVIAIDKFFQWAHSALRSRPYETKTMKARLFAKSKDEYKKISAEIKKHIKHIEFLCTVGLFVEDKIKMITDKTKKGLAKDMNNHIIARLYRVGVKKNIDTCSDAYFNEAVTLFSDAFLEAQSKTENLDSGLFFKSKDSIKRNYLN